MTAIALDRPTTARPQAAAPVRHGDTEGGARNSLASVSKALGLLVSLQNAGHAIGVSALARDAGMPKSTAHRLLAHLEESGFVERIGTAYQLGWRLFELGNHVELVRPAGLRDIALAPMTDLHHLTGMTVHLTTLQGSDVLVMQAVHSSRTPSVNRSVGSRLPITLTAAGKVLLAFRGPEEVRQIVESGLPRRTPYSVQQPGQLIAQLHDVRRQGIAFALEENKVGIVSLAAPIVHDGEVAAAVSLSGPRHPVNPQQYATAVRRAAQAISRQLTSR